MSIIRKAKVPAIFALVLLAACGPGAETPDFTPTDPFPSNVAVSGTYNVKTVAGAALPITFWREEGDNYSEYSLVSESFTLTPSGTFTRISILAPVGQAQTSKETCTGTYIRDITFLFFTESSSGPTCYFAYPGIWNGASRITVRYGADRVAEK